MGAELRRVNGMVRLCDLRPISPDEFEAAGRICRAVRELYDSRAAYIETHHLDPQIVLPAANWSENASNAIHDLFRVVANPTYDVINRLRLYTQPFSGYQLNAFAHGYGKTLIPEIPADFDARTARLGRRPDRWVKRYLLITRPLPKDVRTKAPRVLGEIGWDVDGHPVNYDACACQERVNLLFEAGVITWLRRRAEAKGSVSILDIGGGYGGLAYHLKRLLPAANYLICDLPEALLFSALYLGLTQADCPHTIYDGADTATLSRRDRGFKFVANHMFDDLAAAGIGIDLAINTLSFAEMSPPQVCHYAESLKRLLGDRGILFEQNSDLTALPKEYLPTYFACRERLSPRSVPVLEQGVANLWANRRIEGLIDASCRPFDASFQPFPGLRWRLYWQAMAVDCARRKRLHWSRVRARCCGAARRVVGPRLYTRLKGWWHGLRGGNGGA